MRRRNVNRHSFGERQLNVHRHSIGERIRSAALDGRFQER
jgi:hypothetical protein